MSTSLGGCYMCNTFTQYMYHYGMYVQAVLDMYLVHIISCPVYPVPSLKAICVKVRLDSILFIPTSSGCLCCAPTRDLNHHPYSTEYCWKSQ